MFWLRSRSLTYLPPPATFLRRILRPYSINDDKIKNSAGTFESIASESARSAGVSRRIELIESEKDWNLFSPVFISDLRRFPVIGFDCEWPPVAIDLKTDNAQNSFSNIHTKFWRRKRSKVALIQLATPNGTVALVRIDRMHAIPDSLRDLMADAKYLKVGVESKWDGVYLREDYPSLFQTVKGVFDVRYILHPDTLMDVRYRSRNKVGRMYASLSSLCQDYLNIPMDKSRTITCSDWAAPVLTPEQIQYAASDAQLSVDVFFALLQYVGFDINQDDWDSIYEYCRPRLDQPFRVGVKEVPQVFFPKSGQQPSDSVENGDRERLPSRDAESNTVTANEKT